MGNLVLKFFRWLWHSIFVVILGIVMIVLGAYFAFLTYQIAFKVPNVSVPSVLGLEIGQAQQVLYQAGLKIKIIEHQLFSEGDQLYVFSQDPIPGSEVKKNRTVEVDIREQGVGNQVPDLIGKTIEEAKSILIENGYKIGNIAYSAHHQMPKGSIIAQIPNPGETIQSDLKVNILVSKGK
ncbi:MAG: PASTA domain-containing protein [Candidatus Atribacteria bacterium]|nr:PASTA domain-containing protein [Candidatus Atribacteria bacterium]